MTRTGRGALLLILLLAIAAVSGLLLGAANVAPADVWRALAGQETDPSARTIVLSLRLPRVTAAALTGIALTISGTLFQALLRNPLAEPYLLGVSSGAALGAVLALTALGGVLGYLGTVGFALAGGLAAIGIVFRVALAVGRLDTHVLILAGVVVSAFFGAGVLLLLSLAEPDATRAAVLWTMGSLERAGWESTVALGLVTAAGGTVSFALSRHLNALALGEEAAAYLGARVELVRRSAYFIASLLAAVAVSTAGVIGFVGLVIPHGARMIWGSDHRRLLPLGALGGGAALVLADTVARVALRPLELPVGVVTALLGVPLFLVLLRRSYA
ncbi:iron ABC transporter permease [Candidatus Palauibacter polyketidifaciens]|uniref:FecCD family ABC transporter permease n=1 Tax=Candidatus Palauibacter polyketidifaciens TaxID=3056740 RepID=UPI0023A1F151|nr:iron ABC transporter permease [Candidatus Palauibacter polyketidifaciens]MDE2719654.1 iron ABC transporter permease [Candidatus Palauibacter polyketidifaciens]